MPKEIEVNGDIIEFPDDMPDSDIEAVLQKEFSTGPAEATDTGLRGFVGDEPVTFGPGGFIDALRGVGGAVKQTVGGALGLGAGGLSGMIGLQQGPDVAADAVRRAQEKVSGAFAPATREGELVTGALSTISEPIAALTDLAGEGATELTGSPAIGAGVRTALEGAPMLLGRGNPLTVNRKPLTNQQLVAQEAQSAGYRLLPSDVNPQTLVRGAVESAAGKPRMRQNASFKNQQVTNDLAAQSVGLPPGTEMTRATLEAVRHEAGQAYKAIEGAGTVAADVVFRRDVSAALSNVRNASGSFSSLINKNPALKELVDTADTMRNTPSWDTASVAPMTRILRDEADKAFRAGESTVGRAYRDLSKALEDATERRLSASASPEIVQNFRDARQRIAKSYTIQEALDGDGFVSARKLAADRKKGKPLSGELDLIARVSEQFPGATRVIKEKPIAVGRLSTIAGAGGGGAAFAGQAELGALLAGAAVGGPLVRATMLSRLGQSLMARPFGAPETPAALTSGLLGTTLIADDELRQ